MASLEELRKKLYGREGPDRPAAEDFIRSRRTNREKLRTFWSGDETLAMKKTQIAPRKRRWLLNLFVFSSVITVGVVFYIGYQIFFIREEVSVVIAGPEGVGAGERADFAVLVNNSGAVALEGVELNITYPENSIPLSASGEARQGFREQVSFDRIAPGEEIKHAIALRLLGKRGDTSTMSVIVVYRPENIQSRLTKRASTELGITRAPFVITTEGPPEVARDQTVVMTFNLNSEAPDNLGEFAFRIDYPQGFEFTSADSEPDIGNNIWLLGGFARGETRRITVRGSIRGQPEEVKAFNAVIGQYKAATGEWLVFLEESAGPKIASPFLFVRQEMEGRRDGVLSPGENVRFTIFYKNNLSRGIDDVVITVRFNEEVLNLATLRVDGGAYDPASREIRWTPASRPELKELAPGEEGAVSFSVALRPSPPIRSFSDKNFMLVSRASIDTASIPEEFFGVKLRYEDAVEFKIGTRLVLAARAAYFDSPAGNTGPIPPRARQETTYTIFWQLANQSNDAVDVEVRGGLPPNVRWLGPVGEAAGTAVFSAASGEVTWSIPRLSAGTGILKPQATLAFRVAIIPGEDQVGTSPVLAYNVRARAVDDFTKEAVEYAAGDINTELRGDRIQDIEQWRVAP